MNELEPIVCPECKQDLRATEKWKIGPIYHCTGGHPDSFGNWNHTVHHGRMVYRCACRPSRVLGCDRCIGNRAGDVACQLCRHSADGKKLPEAKTTPPERLTQLYEQYRGGTA